MKVFRVMAELAINYLLIPVLTPIKCSGGREIRQQGHSRSAALTQTMRFSLNHGTTGGKAIIKATGLRFTRAEALTCWELQHETQAPGLIRPRQIGSIASQSVKML